MAYLVRGSYEPMIEKSLESICSKMVDKQKKIRETEAKTKELKMDAREEFARERLAVNKQHVIRDKMQEIDARIDKIETKIQYEKGKLFLAKKRDEENIKTCQSLEDNRLDVPSFSEKMSDARDRLSCFVEEIAKKNRKMDAIKAKITEAELREKKAKFRFSNYEEIIRLNEQSTRVIARNYRPKTDREYEVEIRNLKYSLDKAVKNYRARESELAILEKEERKLDAEIAKTKKQILNAKQAQNEVRGSRK
ncbi:centrosomal protein of 290 kDa-like [Actinia tenebrosa]|uniref:Centrosomal protein of 290 kDa-like n=1 Tax=Actinia tenebrosa TaxID=6105 RepID=A0A6P8H3B6_ACTTE|nr:centrosomal protein of 290 kDa-like [Actinia tenebrosa]